jgi:hypothetical protein
MLDKKPCNIDMTLGGRQMERTNMERCPPVMALSSRVGTVFDEEPYDIETFLRRLLEWRMRVSRQRCQQVRCGTYQ